MFSSRRNPGTPVASMFGLSHAKIVGADARIRPQDPCAIAPFASAELPSGYGSPPKQKQRHNKIGVLL